MKTLHIFLQFLKLNLSLLSVYRANLVNHAVNALLWGSMTFITTFLLTERIPGIHGWDRSHLLLLSANYNFIIGVFYFLFSRSFRDLQDIVFHGKLDQYLLKPIDAQLHLSIREINIPALIRVILGAITIIALCVMLQITVPPLAIGLFVLSVSTAVLFLYSFWYILLTLLIWFPRLDNLNDFLTTLTGLGKYPKDVLLPYSGNLFVYVIMPLFMTVSIPTKILSGEVYVWLYLLFIVLAIGLFLLSRKFWKFALRYYVGASI